MTAATMNITFGALTRMLFGDDVTEKFGTVELEDLKTKEMKSYNFFEAWTKFNDDSLSIRFNPLILLVPSFFNLGIGQVT